MLDDDPTGTQSTADVPVVLEPSVEALTDVLRRSTAAYIVTNSRAMDSAQAVHLLARVRDVTVTACRDLGVRAEFVLRGDSTLRGHVFEETALFEQPGGVVLFSPAYPGGGRVTVDGVHYLEAEGSRVNVADTEFARDPVFGFRARSMRQYVTEAAEGREFVGVGLDRLRRHGAAVVREALVEAPDHTVIVPDSETDDDLRTVYEGLVRARQVGRPVAVRSASPLAALCAGAFRSSTLARPVDAGTGGVLVVCGSHTDLATRQLARLTARVGEPVVVPTDDALADPVGTAGRVAPRVLRNLADAGVAVLATERERRSEHEHLHHGERVMLALTRTVLELGGRAGAVVAKGGITSAQVASAGLTARSAWVRGPLFPGVPLWDLHVGHRVSVPYVVVPGNVGGPEMLCDVVSALAAA